MGHIQADMSAPARPLERRAAKQRLNWNQGRSEKVMLTITRDAAGPRARVVDRALQFGPGMRVQRLAEAAFMIAAIFTQDVRFAYVTLFLTVLQVMSPRWVPIARAVARVVQFRGEHRIGDLYFDLGGIRGASAVAALVQVAGIALVWMGYRLAGFMVLTLPTASFLMAPTLGFCCGCWFYVLGRDWLAKGGWLRRGFDDVHDIAIARSDGPDQPELPA